MSLSLFSAGRATAWKIAQSRAAQDQESSQLLDGLVIRDLRDRSKKVLA